MSQMDYFRRPALAGKNITHPTTGRVRGSVRRSDADGVSAVPYFPDVTALDTLTLLTDTGATPVTLSANDLNTILADINTALGATGTAYSEDGCIGIATTTAGAAGFIRVTGGTASEALGFNTFGGALPIEGRSSDLYSAPEGRVGNPFGAVFPNRENLTSDVLTRNFGRLAANSDVLWSDHVKDSLSFETVAFVVGTDGAFITPTATQRFFLGGGLTAASTRRQLAAYYQIIDTVTGLPANSQVCAVVRGTPVGSPPYANSPSWTDVTGKNILGINAYGQEKVSSKAIDAITAGRFVECPTATFVSSGVVAGDYAQIVSATNFTPSSNNGMRWIVESVLSETVVSLRPMSKSELDTTGLWTFPVEEIQPVVELNENKSGAESFGSIVIKTGPFAHNVTLVVSPPIPTGATYELKAAVPGSLREDLASLKQDGAAAALSAIGSDLDPTDNWILDGLVPTLSAPNCAITAGYVRHHGKVFYIPARTFAPADFTNGTNYVYWSEATGGLVSTTSATGFASVLNNTYAVSSANRGHPVALVLKSGGNLTSVTRMVRRRAEKALSFTVGTSGQFQTLEDAVRYANTISVASGETTSNSGAYPHYEFIITNNLTVTADISFTMPCVTIRGIDSRTVLTMGGQRFNITSNTTDVYFKDLIISGSSASLVQVAIAVTRVSFTNIRHAGEYSAIVSATGGGTIAELLVDLCNLTCDSISSCTPTAEANFVVRNSTISCAQIGSVPQAFKGTAAVVWVGSRLLIENCRFSEWFTTGTDALIVDASSTSSDVVIRDTVFNLVAHASVDNGLLLAFNGKALVEHVEITPATPIPRAVSGYGGRTKVKNCYFSVNPEGSAVGVDATEVSHSTISHQDTDANVVGGVAVQVSVGAWNNIVSGPAAVGIRASAEYATVSGNQVYLDAGNGRPLVGIEIGDQTDMRVFGNVVMMPGRPSADPEDPPIGIAVTADNFFRIFIESNSVSMAENGSCIQVGTAGTPLTGENLYIANNSITALCTLGGTAMGVRLHGTVFSTLISGQQLFISGGGSASGIFQADGDYTHMLTTGNRIFVDSTNGAGGVYFVTTANDSQDVKDNFFEAGALSNKVSGFRGTVSGNQFLAAGTFLISDTACVFASNYLEITAGTATLGSGRYDNNTFTIPTVSMSTASSDFQFTNNRLSGNFTGSPVTNSFTMFSGNKVAGTTTIGGAAATKVVVSGNELLGTFTIASGTGNNDVSISGTYVAGNASITVNRHLTISNCIFLGTGTQIIAGGGHVEVSGNAFTGRVSMDGASADQLVSNNKLSGGLAFTVDAAPAYWKVADNRIQSAYNVVSMAFPSFTFPAQVFITISNNTIQHGGGEDTANLATNTAAISFAGDVSQLSVVGNNIAIGRNNTKNDPGGTGLVIVSCLRITGTGGNRSNVITGNMMDIPSTATDFRGGSGGGGLTLDYKFWYFGSGQETGGSGNILSINTAVPNTSPHNGSSFFQAGAAVPYQVE